MGAVNIRKRGKVYQYQFEIAPMNGKRKQFTKSGFRTKQEAQEAGTEAYNEYINTGLIFKESKISYADYLDYWMRNYCEINLKYNTIQAYNTIINKYLKPNLGKYRLASLTSVKLNSFISELCNKYDFSKAYFSNILKVIKCSFREACDLYGFIKYNPTLTLRLPKIEKEKEDVKHVYTQEEIDIILKRFKDNDTLTCVFLTACYTGLRTGEVCALTWNDIDFENKVININHNVYDKKKDEKGKWFLGSTKTSNGKRQVHISETLLKALKNYKKKQNYLESLYKTRYKYYHLEDVKNEFGKVVEKRIVLNDNNLLRIDTLNFVFTKADGTYTGTDIIKYPFNIIHKELGIKKCRFYDLRGSFATKVLRSGVEIRDVADILGHSKIETTENYYISSSERDRRYVSENLDKIVKSEIIDEIISYKL